jgi:imidazolonepropionase-like amidohydrolase
MRSPLPILAAVVALMATAIFSQAPNNELALVGATIYLGPAEEPIPDGVVLIQGGKIAAAGSRSLVPVPRDAQRLDCSGSTIMAGFWNSHVHFFERKWANAAAIPAPELGRQLQDALTRYGFTSAYDLSSTWVNTRTIRDRIESEEVPGPRIRSTGQGLLPPNPGIPPDPVLSVLGQMKTSLNEVADAAQAAAASKRLLDEGVDGVKLFASAPSKTSLSDEMMRAAVAEAHHAGKPVFVHPNTSADILAAVRAGADIVAHTTPATGPWSEDLLSAMKEHNVALTPTLFLWKYFLRHDRISSQDKSVNTAVGQLRAWLASGGTVLFGTDLGAVDPDPTGEYLLMTQSGMSFRQILASLTTTPSGRFGEAKRLGRIAAGLDADLVVLKDDPTKNIRTMANVRYTLRSGKIIYRASE